MKMIEIEMCNPDCKHLMMWNLNRVFCYHPKWEILTKKRRRIPYSRLTEKKPFPGWCPLPDVEECNHPFSLVQTKCLGEINHCLKCGKDL